MIVGNNAQYKMFVNAYSSSNSRLQESMQKLSSGSRMIVPGDAPADLGISERFRAQIHNSEEASRVIQNGINMFQSTDSVLQQVQGMLNRMSELAVAATDSSKSQADRTNLDLEFQQLKTEIGRVSSSAKYNGLQTTGATAVAHWDPLAKRVVYTQPDGSDARQIDIDMRAGNTSLNGISYAFENSTGNFAGDFSFTNDGRYMVYVAQEGGTGVTEQRSLMRLDVQSNTLAKVNLSFAGGSGVSGRIRLFVDNADRIWVADPASANTTSGNAGFNLKLYDVNSNTIDAGGAATTNNWAGGVSMASGFGAFSVYNDRAYYIQKSGTAYQYVSQSLFNSSDKQVLLNNVTTTFGLGTGDNYTVSADGKYIAFEDTSSTSGVLSVINVETGKKASLAVGTEANAIVGLKFDPNNNIYWTDTGNTDMANAIKVAAIDTGEIPQLKDVKIVTQANAGHLGVTTSAVAGTHGFGLSVSAGSPSSRYTFQVGADSGMTVDFKAADVRLTKLGISTDKVTTLEAATAAIKNISGAIEMVSKQRALMGAEVSRLNFIHDANDSYNSNISAAESRIRDVDFASETARMSEAQISAQASTSILQQANQFRSSILKLLQ